MAKLGSAVAVVVSQDHEGRAGSLFPATAVRPLPPPPQMKQTTNKSSFNEGLLLPA